MPMPILLEPDQKGAAGPGKASTHGGPSMQIRLINYL